MTCAEIVMMDEGNHVWVSGTVKSVRSHGKATFYIVEDKTGSVQVYTRHKSPQVGDSVTTGGILQRTKPGILTIYEYR
jgi:aspartyl-tRNA synthetase